jgi:hypothetical protein
MDLLLGLAGLAGVAALLQSKTLPSEKDWSKAIATLATNPDDPSANLTAGKYQVFVLGDYQFGLPHLAKGSDKTLAALAQKELDEKNTATPELQVGMGDEWVLAAKKFPALTTQFYDRASEWYAKAWPGLSDLWKMKVREQGAKLAIPKVKGQPRKGLPSGWEYDGGVSGKPAEVDNSISHSGAYSIKLSPGAKEVAGSGSAVRSSPIQIFGEFIEVSAFVRTNETENPKDGMTLWMFNDTDRNPIEQKTILFKTDIPFWRKLYIKSKIPANAVIAQIHAGTLSRNGNVWIDDLSIKVDGKEIAKNGSVEEK